jgi:hypothetical protein
MEMMGQWQDVRGPGGRLLCRIDAERRLLEIARNGEAVVVDLDVWLAGLEEKREGLAGLVGGVLDTDRVEDV